jgi:hypothetical protein
MQDDPLEWFSNPEHEHMIGLDRSLKEAILARFGHDLPDPIFVDCGVEGSRSFTYHFRIFGVPDDMHGKISSFAMDELSRNTPYRFEVACVETFLTE